MAALLSFLCKKLDSSEIDDEEKLMNAFAAHDEDLCDTADHNKRPKVRVKVKTRSIDPEKLEKLRENKMKEKRMMEVMDWKLETLLLLLMLLLMLMLLRLM